MKQTIFSDYHPMINFLFFAAVIIFGMCFIHPLFLACSIIFSAVFMLITRGRRALRLMAGIAVMFAIIAFVNPFFNQNGSHAVFFYGGGRIYSIESLCYGMALGGIFVTVLFWFAAYNAIMSSDKFLYLFARFAPSVSLVMTMVLRLVPNFRKKAEQISSARKCIGKAGGNGSRKERIGNGAAVLSALASWALEGGIVTADSMQSRGYGTGERTSFSIYRFDGRDLLLLIVLIVLIVLVAFCALHDAMKTSFVPEINIPSLSNPMTLTGCIAYVLLMAIPIGLHIVEVIRWHSLKSGI